MTPEVPIDPDDTDADAQTQTDGDQARGQGVTDALAERRVDEPREIPASELRETYLYVVALLKRADAVDLADGGEHGLVKGHLIRVAGMLRDAARGRDIDVPSPRDVDADAVFYPMKYVEPPGSDPLFEEGMDAADGDDPDAGLDTDPEGSG